MKPEIIALHHGYVPDKQNSAAVPVRQTTAYSFNNAKHRAYPVDLKVSGSVVGIARLASKPHDHGVPLIDDLEQALDHV